MKIALRYFRRVTARTQKQRKPRAQFIADRFEIDIPEVEGHEFSPASEITDERFENPSHMSMRETFWYENRHWGLVKDDQTVSSGGITESWAAQECINKRLYTGSEIADFIHGRMLSPSDRLLDVSEDHSDEDFLAAVNAAQEMLRVVRGMILSTCNEPLLSVKCDDRPMKGQNQGFKAWMPVDIVPASPAPISNDRMYFRFDQVDLMREIAGKTELRGLDQAVAAVRFGNGDAHVEDVWTISARGYLERRLAGFKIDPWRPGKGYHEAVAELAFVVEGDLEEGTISKAFDLVAKLDEIQPGPYDNRWLVRNALTMHTAHWESRPVAPVLVPGMRAAPR